MVKIYGSLGYMFLCQYKDMFGEPGEGAHSVRFMGVALVDLTLTVIGGLVIAHYMKWPRALSVAGLFAVGTLFHWLFCVDTSVMQMIL
jgi:hypothetical protein